MQIEVQGIDEFYLFCTHDDVSLGALPWGDEEFDVGICIFEEGVLSEDSFVRMIEGLVVKNCDWVSTFGRSSERLHDEIDRASVRMGRQKAVGDGSPMTGWNEKLVTCEAMAENLSVCIHGGCDYRLIIVVGGSDDFDRLVEGFREQERIEREEGIEK